MNLKDFLKAARKLAAPYRIDKGKGFRLKDFNPADTAGLNNEDKDEARELLETGVDALSKLQDLLYAQDRWSALFVFQAMDAAGKDGAIKHVMSGVNPQGCQVYSFKVPSPEELDHDFLWRCARCLPERGRIGIFNRSYYEETLVVRVHTELLHRQKLPEQLITKDIWTERFQDIRGFERHLARSGTAIRKFFLNVSKKEQKRRFLERIDSPEKNWKFSTGDVAERAHWDDYMHAYEEMIQETATEESPWFVVPADNKWFTRIIVAAAAVDCLASLGLEYPTLSEAEKAQLGQARASLMGE